MLLTNREIKKDILQNLGNATVIEKVDEPTAQQIAVIWVDDDGLAPRHAVYGILST